ncbi:translation initiation factor eIF 4e-like domain-containing protein [Absidia repens]|uniref:Translation initiation factor eIF 4e-like domain-containing protein n=1 Tax=Absidia repens TaxID=90262 RepID=A0A1X2IAF6_9FUNG|nr:translation initiation factor eIF 4e-like domain-containing protein [Absidia repens]
MDTTNNTNNTNEDAPATIDSVTTVFHDRINYTVKHPLQNTWTLWFDNPGKKANSQSWSQNLKEVVSMDAVEDFWGVYNNIVKVDRLDTSSNYHLFKKGIRPEWEDAANANGGKFSIQFPRNKTADTINNYWLHTILAMIGEQFTHEDQICGGVVSVRKMFFRIALWIKSADNEEIIQSIGRQLKQFLEMPANLRMEFTPHGEAAPGEKPIRTTI